MTTRLYQYAILLHPTSEQKKKGEGSKLIKEITTILAPDDNAAILIAARDIPEEHMVYLDRVEVAVRPF